MKKKILYYGACTFFLVSLTATVFSFGKHYHNMKQSETQRQELLTIYENSLLENQNQSNSSTETSSDILSGTESILNEDTPTPTLELFEEDSDLKTVSMEELKEFTLVGRIIIPSIHIDYPIIDGSSSKNLSVSITKYKGVSIHENGNISLAGHNNKDKRFFGRLDELEIGDTFYLIDMNGVQKTYLIKNIYVVEPTDVAQADQTQDLEPEVTLITCTQNGTKRLIIKAYLDDSEKTE